MDFVVAVFRILASEGRLRMHRFVATGSELKITDLATLMKMAQPLVSRDVGEMASVRLLETRPSGVFVHATVPPPRPYQHAVVRLVNGLLRDLWLAMEGGNSEHINVRDWLALPAEQASGVPTWKTVARRLVFFFTAYTHLRRLLILRELDRSGTCTQRQLCDTIGMSPTATSRQLSKLHRRGLVTRLTDQGEERWRLAQPPGGLQGQIHSAVMEVLKREKGGTEGNPVH